MRSRHIPACLLLASALLHGCPPPRHPMPFIPRVEVANARISLNELSGTVTFAVLGSGNRNRTISVDYATADGTAVGGVDYAPVSGTFVWTAHDYGYRTVDIPIIDNAIIDGDRTFTVTISNASDGVNLRLPETAITILDDDGWGGPGDPDASFGTGGVVTSPVGAYPDRPYGAVLAWGSIVIAGASSGLWRIEKRSATDGSLDAAFGVGGVVVSGEEPRWGAPAGIQTDGTHLYLAGYEIRDDYRWRMEKRLLSDGSLDPVFGFGGVALSDPGPRDDFASGLVIDSTHMFVFGSEKGPEQFNFRWRVEKRDLVQGLPDGAFGAGGAVIYDPTVDSDWVADVVLDSSHLYVVGSIKGPGGWAADYMFGIQKRSIVDGSLDGIFGTVTSDPSPLGDRPYAADIDGTHLYVGGRDDANGNGDWRLEKRALVDGSLDPTFGPAGTMTIPMTGDDEDVQDILVDSGSLYVAGSAGSAFWGDLQWRVERRSAVDGSLDAAFGQGGAIESNPTDARDTPAGILLGPTGLFIYGSDSMGGEVRWRIEKRLR